MKINKIQPIARVTKAGLLLTSMIILSGSLFGQDDKKIEDADTLEIIRGYTGMTEETKMADGTKVDREGNLLLF